LPTVPANKRHAILRANVPQRIYDWINTRKCMHVDAWLYQMPDDMLYFVVIGSVAGRVKNATHRRVWRIDPFGIYPYQFSTDIAARGLPRRLGGPWARKHIPWANAYHKYIRQAAWEMCAPFVRRSIVLHYVYTKPKLDDPLEGIENTYATSSRAARDAVHGTSVRDARRIAAINGTSDKSPWTARERSILRTLDKILR